MRLSVFASAVILAAATATAVPALASGADEPPALSSFIDQSISKSSPKDDAGRLRQDMLREIAMTHGARGGLARRTFEINKSLEVNQRDLDTIYNFQPLIIDGGVVPPVITEARNVYDQKASTIIRVVNQVYVIAKQAHFSLVPPTWRSYLLHFYDAGTDAAPPAVQPKSEEMENWRKWMAEGWSQGERQAEAIFEANMNRLKRDFEGMVRYHTLMLQGVVSKPFVASANKGTTTDGSHMNVDEKIYQITILPEFSADKEKWKPVPLNPQ